MCDLPHTLKLFESNKVCFFLHVSNVSGMCRGVCMRSHVSYAEAWGWCHAMFVFERRLNSQMLYFVKNNYKIIHKCQWGPEGAVSSTADPWQSPSEDSRGKIPENYGLFISGEQINSLKYTRNWAKYLFWIQVWSQPVFICFKVKFEDWVSKLRRLSFLCHLQTIIIACINPWR